MPRNLFLALILLLLPQVTLAGCKGSNCLIACRSCEKPWPKNGTANCPAVGFECDDTGPYPYAFAIESGHNGKDCLSLKCTGTRSLFVRGAQQAYLACKKGLWHLPGEHEDFMESTKSAICLRKCDETACTKTVPPKYQKAGYTNAIIASPTPGKPCASADCPDGPVYGGFNNGDEPELVKSDDLTCTGSGKWKDGETGSLFDFPMCFKPETPQCTACSKGQIDMSPSGAGSKDFEDVPINTDGACGTLVLRCRAGANDLARIILNNGEVNQPGTSESSLTLTCNPAGTGWMDGLRPVNRAVCFSEPSKCKTCTRAMIDTSPKGTGSRAFDMDVIYRDVACYTRVILCTSVAPESPNIDLNDGIHVGDGPVGALVTMVCNEDGTGWRRDGFPTERITRAVCNSQF